MRLKDAADDEKEFDFEAWAARPTKATFDVCAKAALEALAVSNDDLGSRLRGALFCLLYADRDQVPPICRATFDEIASYVDERLAGEKLYAARRPFTPRVKLNSGARPR